jgi:protein-export membrane protein SecD/preprotein translocase SecF subunit
MLLKRLPHRLLLIGLLIVGAVSALWTNYRRTDTPTQRGQPVSLGLDLQGGMHLALELDQTDRVSSDPSRDIDLALTILRKRMDEFGVLEPLVQKAGSQRIIVELPGLRDPERAKAIVRRSAFLEFRITDESGALERALPAMDRAIRASGLSIGGRPPAASSAVDRLLGGGSDDSRDSVAGGQLTELIRSSSQLPGEYVVPEAVWSAVDSALRRPELRRLWPRGVDLKWADSATGEYRLLYALEDRPIITGTNLVDARAQTDPVSNAPEVTFELDRAGGRRFGQETARHVGHHMAIVLDGQVQGQPAVIQSRIDRQGRIQMTGRSLAAAQDLALTLRAGALPTPLKIIEERQVGPSLGEDSIRGGITAGIVGTALVIAIVVGYYAKSGALAVLALGLYTLFCFGTLALFGAALSLPGLAGFVLSIGMAVDANVLIFERIREEQDRGKTARLAVDEGFKHAMPAIIDSNLTTILTALFLYRFGTGPVRGFAVTLIVGILASMVTAVFVTRTLYLIWLRFRTEVGSLSVGRFRLLKNAAFDFVGMRRKAYAGTAALLLVGLGFLGARGVRYSVEFTGGTLHQVKTVAVADPARIRDALEARGIPGAEIQRFGGATEFTIRAGLAAAGVGGDADLESSATTVSGALEDAVGTGQFELTRTEAVGPKVGGELRVQAVLAILLSFLAVLGYLAYRFEWRFGVAAIGATAHDILVTIAFIAVLDLEISLVIVAALLTVVGYSLNDTIVIFDRVREKLRQRRGAGLAEVLNGAVNETLPRTLLTGGTALATLAALAGFGGEVIRPFAVVMFFGIFTGTFSSIFIASPILAYIHGRWPSEVRAHPPVSGSGAAPVMTPPSA